MKHSWKFLLTLKNLIWKGNLNRGLERLSSTPALIISGKIVGIYGVGTPIPTFQDKLKNKLSSKKITSAEFDILVYTLRGLSSKQIACKLQKSSRTVESQLKSIKIKLNINFKTELIEMLNDYIL